MKTNICIGDIVRLRADWLRSGNLSHKDVLNSAKKLGTVTGVAQVGSMTAVTVKWDKHDGEQPDL
jgi:hypothetical protein